ncbi:glycosyltransferase [uncultured Tateyamaria sp.]|uniref:glycosyltransferase n=1 Tax=uncultured Tateyamaria sp. TaxID=455651 RepID=UPI00263573D6|nr:glycosyltransferase [uncultured Tateyamaria sp.]
MSDPLLRLSQPRPVLRRDRPTLPVGRQLVNAGLITQTTLIEALGKQHTYNAPLGEILVADGHVDRRDVLHALATQHDTDHVDLRLDPPSPLMARALPARLCQKFSVVPWRWIGTTLLVATTRPDRFDALRAAAPAPGFDIRPVLADQDQINTQISTLHGAELAHRAVTLVPQEISCRDWSPLKALGDGGLVLLAALFGAALIAFPLWVMTALIGWGVVTLVLTTVLKLLALVTQMTDRVPTAPEPLPKVVPHRLPRVSVMVPLFKEERIAEALVARLSRLTYPKALLEVVLVLEAKDAVTRATLARTKLPQWMRVVEVPDDGTITTKPRALNYALDFCDGDIIGVWDAEDAPEIDQIEKVVAHYAQAGPDVACLQGILDYYNSSYNWIARCFTIEYASWWRLVLPGVARMGLVLPLGGTTLFFRREILEELGGWDAHNVTEDADLGVRLARRGYRTELIPTATFEEANCRAWPWVKQRSRWLKGYLITYCVHMRNPRALLHDLGWKRFIGFQVMFLATFSQFVTLPLLWSFLLPTFGLPHPVTETLGAGVIWPLAGFFIFAEILNALIGILATSAKERRHLIPWVFTLPLYFPLGALASYKALYELVFDPYYWDKTQHGTAQP